MPIFRALKIDLTSNLLKWLDLTTHYITRRHILTKKAIVFF